MRNSFRLTALLLIATVGQSADGKRYDLSFLPGKNAEKARGYLRSDESPCDGPIVIARVSSIPLRKDGPFIPDTILEVDAKRQVVQRWHIPYWATPAGVKGNLLLLDVDPDSLLWVTPNGQIYPSKEKTNDDHPPEYPNCQGVAEFLGNDGMFCKKFKDRDSGRVRIIMYVLPGCS